MILSALFLHKLCINLPNVVQNVDFIVFDVYCVTCIKRSLIKSLLSLYRKSVTSYVWLYNSVRVRSDVSKKKAPLAAASVHM